MPPGTSSRLGIQEHFLLLLPLLLGFAAVWSLLPQHRRRNLLLGCVCGLAALVLGGLILPQAFATQERWPAEWLFYPFAGMAVASGLIMIVQTKPVYSALWFAIVILNTCGLFLIQGGTFLAAATIIIYTGAIIVTFLFVMMLAQQTGTAEYDRRSREPFLSTLAGFVLLGGLLYTLEITYRPPTRLAEARERISQALYRLGDQQANLSQVGDELYLQAGEGNRRLSVSETLHNEADRFPGWPELGKIKEAIGNTAALIGRAVGTGNRQQMQTALNQMLALADNIDAARTRHAAKLALPLEASKLSTLSQRTPTTEKPAATAAGAQSSKAFQSKPGEVTGLGKSLFGDYLYGVLLAAELLLVVTIGAIVITHRRREVPA